MSISGDLADLPLVDLLQFIHLSGRSGTLQLERERETAHISFNRGKIATAWCETSLSVSQLLLETGALTPEALDDALHEQQQESPRRALGPILVARGLVKPEDLRDVVARKIEHTIIELVRWRSGGFSFLVDDVRCDDDLAFAPGEVAPQLDINTQMVLMEAVRVFDERNAAGSSEPTDPGHAHAEGTPVPAAGPTLAAGSVSLPMPPLLGLPSVQPLPSVPALPADARTARPRARVQIVTANPELATELAARLLPEQIVLSRVGLRDAGAPPPGEGPPLVVIDLRARVSLDALTQLRRSRPRAMVVALAPAGEPPAPIFAAGAMAVLPHDAAAVAACCVNLIGSRDHRPVAPTVDHGPGLARLRRVIGDIRSGLWSATMALNLMTIVADSVERAVLFVAQRDALVAIGAFGARRDGTALAECTRGLALPLDFAGVFADCVSDGRARSQSYAEAELPAPLREVVDAPRSGQTVIFPVMGARRVIAVIYTDNGRRQGAIDDMEIVELATAQVGLAFENELLRRQAMAAAQVG